MLHFTQSRILKVASRRLLSFPKRSASATPQQLIDDCLNIRSSVQALSDKFKGPLEEATQKNTLLPFVFLLGNHSSGKSSFINYVCQRKIQTAGVAPTDDTFTIICPGSADSDRDGPAVIGDPDMGFQGLRSFGPQLIHHTQLKVRSSTALNDFCIVDTPGMIDSPMRRDSDGINRPAAMDRGYDFEGVCRWYAERADVILLFFDPDKPGTTGETLSILTNSLVGQDYKLHIILNKADQFRKIHDFARAYGSLCWNLSKVIQRKDLPRIYTMCLPAASRPSVDSQEGEGRSLGQGIADLEEAREEVVAEVLNAPKRRVDNEVSRLSDSVCVLQMHCKIIEDISSKYQAALLRSRLSLGAALCASVLLPSAAIIGMSVMPDSSIALSLSSTVLLGQPLIALLAATTGVGAAATGGLYWWKSTSLGSLAHRLVSDDSLDASYRKIYVRRIAEKDEFTASLWKRVHLHIQLSLTASDLQAMEAITPKELKVLENVLDIEVPKLRRMVGPSMGAMGAVHSSRASLLE